MGARGGFQAITPDGMQKLRAAAEGDSEDDIIELFDDLSDLKEFFDTDKAWDEIHRILNLDSTADGELDPEAGDYPFCLLLFGGEQLYFGDDYHLYLIDPDGVADLASALSRVDQAWMRKRFWQLDLRPPVYRMSEEGFRYPWGNSQGLPQFFARAAAAGKAVVFYAGL
jgi:hypothetical protein